jgi:hypothetical protein
MSAIDILSQESTSKKYPLLVGIGHRKLSGKDTLAKFIGQYLKVPFSILRFADALKEEVAHATLTSVDEINYNKDVFRPLLQWWGTEFRRQYQGNDNYWVDKVDRISLNLYSMGIKVVLVPDVRFKNEVQFIRRNNGILIVVDRGNMPIDLHPSEIALTTFNGWDYVVSNNGTLDELKDKSKDLAKYCNEMVIKLKL